MTVARIIEEKIGNIEPSRVFSISDLGFPPQWWENVRIKLGRMVKSGVLEKAGRGKYYRPKPSIFGILGPDRRELVKDLLYTDGKIVGYMTGYHVWGQMGLTSQISNTIVIGTNRRRDPMNRGNHRIRFIMQPNPITEENVPMLQILDALKLMKMIPDTDLAKSITVLAHRILGFDSNGLDTFIQLSLAYPPRVRALLGMILEDSGNRSYERLLKSTLNPSTKYSLGLPSSHLRHSQNWNII